MVALWGLHVGIRHGAAVGGEKGPVSLVPRAAETIETGPSCRRRASKVTKAQTSIDAAAVVSERSNEGGRGFRQMGKPNCKCRSFSPSNGSTAAAVSSSSSSSGRV